MREIKVRNVRVREGHSNLDKKPCLICEFWYEYRDHWQSDEVIICDYTDGLFTPEELLEDGCAKLLDAIRVFIADGIKKIETMLRLKRDIEKLQGAVPKEFTIVFKEDEINV
jgi:hypothetical protein